MTLIDQQAYKAFCQQCGVIGFHHEEPFDTARLAYPLAEVADWMIQQPEYLRRFLRAHLGDAEDIAGIRGIIDEETGYRYPKNMLSVKVLRDWIGVGGVQ